MMSPLAEADFTQADTQKYFVNLFGADELEYGTESFRQYQGYLQMMQDEGIAMITDRNAPFEEYLGSADDPQGEHDPGNLKELVGGGTGTKLEIDDLVRQIDEYMKDRNSTSLKETVGRVLTPADSGQSVGNIWLKSGDEQFRALDWGQFDGTEYTVQIMDDISYYRSEDVSFLYEILRPGRSSYITLSEEKQPAFLIKKSRAAWPEGSYTVRQTVIEGGVKCAIKGYAYFNLEYPPQYVDPITYPVTVKVTARLDGSNWTDHGKNFMLQPAGGGALRSLTNVPEGSYTVCEVVRLAADGTLEEGVDTGVRVDAENADAPNQVREVFVDYCSVKFYDAFPDGKLYGKDTKQAQQNVLKGTEAKVPEAPQKEKFSFIGWVTEDGSAFGPDQFNQINKSEKLYAKWERIEDPRYQVVIEAWKDGGEWPDAGRTFALRGENEGEGQFIYDLAHVLNGTYRIYDITGGSPASRSAGAASADANVKVGDGDTGVTVKVEGKDVTEAVNYYTVTFYDGNRAYGMNTPQRPMIVLKGKKAEKPEKSPSKAGYRFRGWMTAKGGRTEFDFDQPVENKTDIFALFTEKSKSSGSEEIDETTPGGGEEIQVVAYSQETESFSQIPTTAENGKEPKTGDNAYVEIYATVAMIAGLTYLLLYFMDESRGMTEREKEVFVAAFIRWAKKGGRFRRCCAIVMIFCLLVYYHSVGKRVGRNCPKGECLRRA